MQQHDKDQDKIKHKLANIYSQNTYTHLHLHASKPC